MKFVKELEHKDKNSFQNIESDTGRGPEGNTEMVDRETG